MVSVDFEKDFDEKIRTIMNSTMSPENKQIASTGILLEVLNLLGYEKLVKSYKTCHYMTELDKT
jgi:hypothetical protein